MRCGRCEEACPAVAAGSPLSPREFIHDLWSANHDRKIDGCFQSSSHLNSRDRQVAGGNSSHTLFSEDSLIHRDALWSCLTCRSCVDSCPMLIEHVDCILELRRLLN